MQNIFKRNNIYYIRLSIPQNIQIYFNTYSYIRSLKTKNKKYATIISKYLIAKLNYIKRSVMILSSKEIHTYIEEFKHLHFDDIINRNITLSIEEIDDNISNLKTDISIENHLIKSELYDLSRFLNTKYHLDSIYGYDVEDAEAFKKYIIQIKINALADIKKDIQARIIQSNTTIALEHTSNNTDIIMIEDAIKEYIEQKNLSKEKLTPIITALEHLDVFLKRTKHTHIHTLKNKDLIAFRKYFQKLKSDNKPGSINGTLGKISTFIKFCDTNGYLQRDISKGIKLKLTIQEIQDSKRNTYTDNDIKKIFQNINMIKYPTPKSKKLRSYHDEYELIIKIAMYTGARENEIIQLTKNDIQQEDNIYYFDINIYNNKKLKNISSIRKIPIHPEILEEVLHYTKQIKRNNIFTIKVKTFANDYSSFKKQLGFNNKLVFHCFRNTLQDKLKQQRVQNMIINELTGHSVSENEIQTDGYTNKYDLAILYDELIKVKYEY